VVALVPFPVSRDWLVADCGRCQALCCVVAAFRASSDFAVDKPAGTPCPHLSGDDRCDIHGHLRSAGFPGCAAFDCFGAGQHFTATVLAGAHWRHSADAMATGVAVFHVVRLLHELLWYLTEAYQLPETGPLAADLRGAAEQTLRLAAAPPDELRLLDVDSHRRGVTQLLSRASELARQAEPGRADDLSGADLAGTDLRGTTVRGASLRGARLARADLRGLDLTRADLTGADLRGADVRGAGLVGALFLTRPQLASARGDATTTIPSWAPRPAHWATRRPRHGQDPSSPRTGRPDGGPPGGG
jgi:hypothetical protein